MSRRVTRRNNYEEYVVPPSRQAEDCQVTSRGCSRGFILCVLYRALLYVSKQFAQHKLCSFPFDSGNITLVSLHLHPLIY
jgi:hypothetical protein